MFWFYSLSIRHLYHDYVDIFLPNIIIKIIYVSTRWSMRSLFSFRQGSVHHLSLKNTIYYLIVYICLVWFMIITYF